MVDIERLRSLLRDRRLSFVAEKTGLSEPTVRAVRDGKESGGHRLETLMALEDYFEGQSV